MEREAKYASEVIKSVYTLDAKIILDELESLWIQIDNTGKYCACLSTIYPYIQDKYSNQCILLLSNRDFISINDWPDIDLGDWLFGFSAPEKNIAVVSGLRLKGNTSDIRTESEISEELYKRRFQFIVVHELGHIVIEQSHYKEALWKDVITGKALPLGDHCDNNACAMYQTIDVKTPDPRDEYLILRKDNKGENKYDSGLDDVLDRMQKAGYNWLCSRCNRFKDIK